MRDFPDLHHFEHIRQRLWCGQEFGQAAVMVGSGFSRNAEKIAPSTPDLPAWRHLAEAIYDELYPQISEKLLSDEQKKHREKSLEHPLRLASEYEFTFGRAALDDLLIRSIPDNQYNPGKLHTLLLSLRWSDIFTTNYDRLLERTQLSVYDRKYELIYTPSDIPRKMKPRIVKLHGSFSSYRPFIITEEDYRTYPQEFAPFVNMVQQSIMENVFCLIGFSGDDPNFLNWIGWVRDNLGKSTPYIYLCGLFDNLSETEKKFLSQTQNIITVDISPKFPKAVWFDSSIRHAKSIEWFLRSLKNGQSQNQTEWPTILPQLQEEWEYERQNNRNLPELIPGSAPPFETEDIHVYSSDELNTDQLRHLSKQWSQNRKYYPGWVVCPRRNREIIWHHTKTCVGPVLNSIDCLPCSERLLLVYELNWRFEITLTPLLCSILVEKFTSILDIYNPYPQLIDLPNAVFHPDKVECSDKEWNWNKLRKAWVELAFALARVGREDHNENQFRLWIGHLEKIVTQNPEWQARWFYERCLFHLFRVEFNQVHEILEDWLTHPVLDFWEIKRASILAELGEFKEAEKIAKVALDKIRSRLQPYLTDYALLSQEAWAMKLLKLIQFEREVLGKPQNINRWAQQNSDRVTKLESFRCSPDLELEYLSDKISGMPPKPKPQIEKKTGFYPGTTLTSHNLSDEPFIYSILPAFNYLRLLEEGGIPIICGSVFPASILATEPAQWIRAVSPRWSFSYVLRAHNSSKIQNCFSFIYLSTLDQTTIDHLHSWIIDCLNLYSEKLPRGQFLERRIEREISKMLIELSSCLCFRFTEENLDQLLTVALNLYRNMSFGSHSDYYSCIDKLFKGIFYGLSQQKIISSMLILLALPIPEANGFNVERSQGFLEPFRHISTYKVSDTVAEYNYSVQVHNLFRIIREGTLDARNRSIIRVIKLDELNLLNSDEKRLFAEALWSRLDEKYPFLPQLMETSYYKFSVLRWPETHLGIAEKGVREFLLSQNSIDPTHKHFFSECLGATKQPVMDQSGIDWSAEDIANLLNKILTWWRESRVLLLKYLELNSSFSFEDTKNKLNQLIETLAYVIFPRITEVPEDHKVEVKALISDLEAAGIYILSASTMALFIEPENLEQVSLKLRDSLASTKQDEVDKAIQSLFYWLVYARNHSLPEPPPDLLNELVNRVFVRRQPGLSSAIDWLASLIREMPEILNTGHYDSLQLALEYLLKETELPSLQELEMTIESNPLIRFEERPEYRRLASRLAHCLYSFYEKQNKEIPSILVKWKNVSENDVLPEVRKVWQ